MSKQELGRLQKEWIRRLRSGDYKQGRNYLKTIAFLDMECLRCCFGIACEITAESGMDLSVKEITNVHPKRYEFDEKGAILPIKVMEEFLFLSATGTFKEGFMLKIYRSLSSANDDGVIFAELADFVEANPAAVFSGPV